MESTRETAFRIVEAVSEQTNDYDAVDIVVDILDPETKPDIRNYKGNSYIVLSEGQMKNPENGDWQNCIHYKSVKEGILYTREKEDFDNKFSRSET
ncbi:MAG: hypothetical protein P8J32_01990 [bacterium]|nr:hypothetical protein [bacterium]